MTQGTNDPYLGRLIAGKYRLDTQLGVGSVGTVYRATHVQLDRPIAVKILRASLAGDPVVVARFTREAQLASRVEHPNVVRVHDCGTEPDGLTYLAMELLEGVELAELMASGNVLPSERIVDLLSQVLSALAAAHRLGIVHRDLKPENILVQQATGDDGRAIERVKVADFGIARVYGEAAAPGAQITSFGQVSGTPEYMSPEQALAEELDGRSDLYACGAVLYEMLAGRAPFVGETPLEILEQHIRETPQPPWAWRDVDARLAPVAMRALAKARDDRYADAAAMRAALLAALELPPSMHRHEPAAKRPVHGSPGSVLIETGPSVLVSQADNAPSVLIDNGPSVLVTSSADDASSVLIASGPSVLIAADESSRAPSVLIESGSSVLIETEPSVVVPSSDAKPAVAAPVAPAPAAGATSRTGTVLAVVIVTALAAAGAYWALTMHDVGAPPPPPVDVATDAGPHDAAPVALPPTPRPRPIHRRLRPPPPSATPQ